MPRLISGIRRKWIAGFTRRSKGTLRGRLQTRAESTSVEVRVRDVSIWNRPRRIASPGGLTRCPPDARRNSILSWERNGLGRGMFLNVEPWRRDAGVLAWLACQGKGFGFLVFLENTV